MARNVSRIGRIVDVTCIAALVAAGMATAVGQGPSGSMEQAIGRYAASAFSPAHASAVRAQPDNRRVDPAVAKAVDQYLTAVLAGDARAVASLYTEDGLELPNFETVAKGRAAIERRYRAFFAGPVKITAFTFSHLESVERGDLAYDVGTYAQRLALPDGKTGAENGKYVVILRRQEGIWRAVYSIYNCDTPRGTAGGR